MAPRRRHLRRARRVVVAVANGTINRVGWHKRGGWRLWVRDAAANQFYYAHLSGYAPRVFHTRHVRAGDVLGFVGNTGDAFASPPHLHFEVHPHQLLRLRYDGAVNPTTYLNSWLRMRSVHAPFPVHPRLPRHPSLRREARQVFRQLLVARHLIEQPTTPIEEPEVDQPARRGPPSTPGLLALREEPAMPTVSCGKRHAHGSSALRAARHRGLRGDAGSCGDGAQASLAQQGL